MPCVLLCLVSFSDLEKSVPVTSVRGYLIRIRHFVGKYIMITSRVQVRHPYNFANIMDFRNVQKASINYHYVK